MNKKLTRIISFILAIMIIITVPFTAYAGDAWDDITSGGIIMNYARSKGYNNIYDVTYAEFQEVLGVYNGD